LRTRRHCEYPILKRKKKKKNFDGNIFSFFAKRVFFFFSLFGEIRNPKRQRKNYLIAMDALYFGGMKDSRVLQYRKDKILRELNKAFAAFTALPSNIPIATGYSPLLIFLTFLIHCFFFFSSSCVEATGAAVHLEG
jgi:hypothetical protein